MRRVEQRVTGQFLKVEGPDGVVVSIPEWMVDIHVCAGMKIASPQIDLASLVDLKTLFAPTAPPSNFPSENGIARGEADEEPQSACADLWQADEPDVRATQAGRDRQQGTGGSDTHACPNSDAGRRPSRRGAR